MTARGSDRWVIEANDVARRFGGQTALAGINLKIEPGTLFGLLGPDGAGKTTLVQILAAILDPSEGSCRVLGYDTRHQSAAITSRIGYMSQGFTLYDRLTVDENLAFAGRIRGVTGERYRRLRGRLLDMAGLARFTGRPAGKLSGGMRKKLSLCTNLIHAPPLLLLDEPSLGVDPLSRRELWAILTDFLSAGTTIVVTTPYLDEAQQCRRLGVLDRGRMLAIDAPEVLRARVAGRVYELTTDDFESAEAVLAANDRVTGLRSLAGRVRFQLRSGEPLSEGLRNKLDSIGIVRNVEPSLEDAYVDLIAKAKAFRSRAAPVFPAHTIPVSTERPAIHVGDVVCRFADFVAVDHVTLNISGGEIFGLLGPNGAGKTTLIRALTGLLKPASGELHVADVDVRRNARALRQRVGYMSQRFSLYPDLTIGENLQFFAGAYGLRGAARDNAIAKVSEPSGLVGLEDRIAGQLSAALRQRLALACAIMHRPAVLFLDEPTSGVDPLSRQRFWRLIQGLAASGMAVLVTTHYLEEASYCHRVGLMSEGQLIAAGTPAALRAAVTLPTEASIEDIFMAYLRRDRQART